MKAIEANRLLKATYAAELQELRVIAQCIIELIRAAAEKGESVIVNPFDNLTFKCGRIITTDERATYPVLRLLQDLGYYVDHEHVGRPDEHEIKFSIHWSDRALASADCVAKFEPWIFIEQEGE